MKYLPTIIPRMNQHVKSAKCAANSFLLCVLNMFIIILPLLHMSSPIWMHSCYSLLRLYLKHSTNTRPIKNNELCIDDISLELATQLIMKKDENETKIKLKDKIVFIKNGPYGPYLTYMKGKKRIVVLFVLTLQLNASITNSTLKWILCEV